MEQNIILKQLRNEEEKIEQNIVKPQNNIEFVENNAELIVKLFNSKFTVKQISARFGVEKKYVQKIINKSHEKKELKILKRGRKPKIQDDIGIELENLFEQDEAKCASLKKLKP